MRLKAEVPLQGAGVGIGDRHVAGLHGDQLLVGLEVVVWRQDAGAYQFLAQNLHEVKQVLRVAVANVVKGVGRHRQAVLAGFALRRALHHAADALHNVVNIGEITLAVAVVEDLDRLAGAQFIGEAKVGHVRAASRAVDSEKAQARAGDVVELGVGVGHEFIALFGGGVEADGVVHLVVCGIRDLFVGAVHTGRTGVDQVPHARRTAVIGVAAGFEDVVETGQVGVYVGVRVGDAVAHTGLGGQVDHDVRLVDLEQDLDHSFIGNIGLDKREVGELLQFGQAGLLDADIVVVVHVVDADDGGVRLPGQQALGQVGADEAGGAGDENC